MIEGAKKITWNRMILHLDRSTADARDFVTVIGENGVGKNILLNILGLDDQFSSGQFYLSNQETECLTGREKRSIERNALPFLFQDFGLVEYEIIDLNLDTGLKSSNLNVSDKRTAKYEALKKADINKRLGTPTYTLFGGEKQGIVCARVLLKNSKVILTDELTGSLDRRNKEQVVETLSQQASQGTLVIVVMHDPYLIKTGNKKIVL